MVIAQGEIWRANLPDPTGSGPGFRRPVLVVQGDGLNFSRIATVVCVPLTSNLRSGRSAREYAAQGPHHGLPKDSVANASQIISLDRGLSSTRAGQVTRSQLEEVLAGIDVVLGR